MHTIIRLLIRIEQTYALFKGFFRRPVVRFMIIAMPRSTEEIAVPVPPLAEDCRIEMINLHRGETNIIDMLKRICAPT